MGFLCKDVEREILAPANPAGVPNVVNQTNNYASGVTAGLEALIRELISKLSEPYATRLFPRTVVRLGHTITKDEQEIQLNGPFSDIMALRIKNKSLNTPVYIYLKDVTSRDTAVPVEAQETLRPQFDCPRRNGAKAASLTLIMFAEADDPLGRVHVMVE